VHQDKPRHSTDLVELRSPIPWSALYPFRTHHYSCVTYAGRWTEHFLPSKVEGWSRPSVLFWPLWTKCGYGQ
jgi:hypothetical protein